MKAAQIVAPRRIVVVETDEPQLMGAGQVKIQLERACLCGSDVPLWDYDHNELAERARLTPRKAKRAPFVDYVNGDPYPLRVGMSIHECLAQSLNRHRTNFKLAILSSHYPTHKGDYANIFAPPTAEPYHCPKALCPTNKF